MSEQSRSAIARLRDILWLLPLAIVLAVIRAGYEYKEALK